MEETSAQKPLSKEEILAEFANTTFDARFADFFYDRYFDEFEVWEDYDNPNEMALKCVKHGLTWYALYKQIGHHEQWCKAAYVFGCEGVQIDVSLENEIECMAEVTERVEYHSKDLFISTKDSEFAKHFDHIKKQYKTDGIFMLFYSEYAKEFGFDRDMLDIVSRKTRAYTDAIERLKSEDFASYPENPKAIPWDRFDDFVLDIAKRRFKGENVDVEPRTLDTLLNAMMQYKAKGDL